MSQNTGIETHSLKPHPTETWRPAVSTLMEIIVIIIVIITVIVIIIVIIIMTVIINFTSNVRKSTILKNRETLL